LPHLPQPSIAGTPPPVVATKGQIPALETAVVGPSENVLERFINTATSAIGDSGGCPEAICLTMFGCTMGVFVGLEGADFANKVQGVCKGKASNLEKLASNKS